MHSLLQAEGLAKSFLGRSIVRDVSLHVEAGEIVGLIGPNGAGKTTVFRMLAGTLVPSAGRVLFDGHDASRLPLHQRAREYRIGYLAQVPSVFSKLSAFDNLCGFLRLLGHEKKFAAQRSHEVLAEFGLTEMAALPAGRLSGGQKRQLEIARLLLIQPRLILMDEPFTGIDPVAVDHIRQLILQLRERGIGIIITEHRVMETVALTDRCYVIFGGKVLVHGSPTDVLQHPEARRAYFGNGVDEVLLKITPPLRRAA